MKVLICGGRDFHDDRFVDEFLDRIHAVTPITFVLEGGGRGADALAKAWALSEGIPGKTFAADWTSHGRAAGPIRNQQMLDEGKPELVVAFPGGRGTADMCRRAEKAGIKVVRATP